MSLSKLKQIHIIIIGSFLCVAAAAALFFFMIKPATLRLSAAQARYDAAEPLGNQSAQEQAMRERVDAVNKVNAERVLYDAQMKQRMPNLSFARRDIGMLALWKEYTRTLGPLLSDFAKGKNNSTFAAINVPTPPWNPNDPIFDKDVITFDAGNVTTVGDFKSCMNDIRRWNNCNRLIMVGEPALVGMSPNLSVAYKITCYIFPLSKGGATIPMAGAATADPNAASGGAAPTPAPTTGQ